MMAQMGGGDAATAKELRRFYGLDLSIPAQLGNYLWRLVRLDLGFSSIYGKPVASVILERLPPTILLMTASLSFAFFFGLLFGVIAARGVNRWPDTLISTLGLVFYATPSFWFGLMAIVVFSVYLQWLPPGGFEDIGIVRTGIWRMRMIERLPDRSLTRGSKSMSRDCSRDNNSTGAPNFDHCRTRRSAILMRPGECTG